MSFLKSGIESLESRFHHLKIDSDLEVKESGFPYRVVGAKSASIFETRRSRFPFSIPEETNDQRVAKFPLPAELVSKIFKYLLPDCKFDRADPCTAICFALTCRLHWGLFRKIHTERVPLNTICPVPFYVRGGYLHLGQILQRWMSPAYRPIRWTVDEAGAMQHGVFPNDIYVHADAADAAAGRELEIHLAWKLAEYRCNRFASLHHACQNFHSTGLNARGDLAWFVPHPCNMGEDWYRAIVFFLKHTVLDWPLDCTEDAGGEWLTLDEYTMYYGVWQTYQEWMLRDWVEEQPEAREYQKVHGLGEGKERTKSLRHAFQMLRLVRVRTEKLERQIGEVVEVMLRNSRGRFDGVKVMQKAIDKQESTAAPEAANKQAATKIKSSMQASPAQIPTLLHPTDAH